ncbi:MAG TPA: bifunctional oligoribonuclease/PAP phosphatase NrnA [Candidatus Anaerostipes excrementavium]|uniref:Bifunctional oligoribonuclease/PAP phosphatase NrnA n=1 Tax=Candidatus Anaerostipes excrementavium TaxID=2838463 RepID=A0A9D1WTV1_9FIRM|nr:bifunctional oligoribonuclease/PAP phosphatase NrnA [uncultured Anaerostipes sp.]HIX66705.1 bifunctional oligoribonuclease/PAP phosphatase NrnA [Candidatus Anaerostipes excrementavium]
MKDFFAQIQKAKTIGITGHIHPDGDCVGSCLALRQYITEHYPEKTVDVYLEPIGSEFLFLSGSETILTDPKKDVSYDLFFVLDCSSEDRYHPFCGMVRNADIVFCIDHHISNQGLGNYCKADPKASATCEVLCGLLPMDQISEKCAECLYTGIIHDTGVFKHSNTTKKTMIYAGELLEKGVPHSKIIDETFFQKTYVQNLVLGKALLNSRLFCSGAVIFASLSQEELDELHASSADLNGIIDQLRITKDVETAVFVYPLDDGGKKVSMRSNGKVNVASIAQEFGGGGHILAAGCTVFGDVEEVKEQLLQKIKIQL